ncbi:MAG: hypothetical protein K0S32_3699 [Bacteroidetes bacterium]|nr:hypothetical protein [Bacteroidota bacterium]
MSIDLEGTILCENRTLQGAQVSVTRDGKAFTSFVTDVDGSYNLYLPLGSNYEISVSKKGYVKKMYTVSTTGVSEESAQKKFPVIVADLEILKAVDGIDYSLFNQPMNKYFFDKKKDNFEFDKDYMKSMLAKVADIRRAEKKALQLAIQKADQDKKDAELAKLKAMQDERLAMEAEQLKMMQQEQLEAKKMAKQQSQEKTQTIAEVSSVNKPTVIESPEIGSDKSDRVMALLTKYKPGVTEEIIEGKGFITIQRVLVRGEKAWLYEKKVFSWGGVSCFRDGVRITESAFDHETKKFI